MQPKEKALYDELMQISALLMKAEERNQRTVTGLIDEALEVFGSVRFRKGIEVDEGIRALIQARLLLVRPELRELTEEELEEARRPLTEKELEERAAVRAFVDEVKRRRGDES